MKRFNNAQEAFEFYYKYISIVGELKSNNRFVNNIGFYIDNPKDNKIKTTWRKWSSTYAEREYKWYLSKNRDVSEIKKFASIWDKMHNGNNIVNSNYGWQWHRNNQLLHVVNLLLANKETRQAVLTIYDGKEHADYHSDTPCTLNIIFNIVDAKLNMTVLMRSNDLWFGFCNDQYCFSKLQVEIAELLGLQIGWYYHFAADFHIYLDKLKKFPIDNQ
jgi:thymidylate synthase